MVMLVPGKKTADVPFDVIVPGRISTVKTAAQDKLSQVQLKVSIRIFIVQKTTQQLRTRIKLGIFREPPFRDQPLIIADIHFASTGISPQSVEMMLKPDIML